MMEFNVSKRTAPLEKRLQLYHFHWKLELVTGNTFTMARLRLEEKWRFKGG